jgi:hypothetical protein
MSRGVRRNALVKASERHATERPGILGVNGRIFEPTKKPASFPDGLKRLANDQIVSSRRTVALVSSPYPTSLCGRQLPQP